MTKTRYNPRILNLNIEDSSINRVHKFMNYTVKSGKKSFSEKEFRNMLYEIKKKYRMNPTTFLLRIFDKLYTPIGFEDTKGSYGSKLKVPVVLSRSRAFFKSIKPIFLSAQKRGDPHFFDRLFAELEVIHSNESRVLIERDRFRDEIHSNRGNIYRISRKKSFKGSNFNKNFKFKKKK